MEELEDRTFQGNVMSNFSKFGMMIMTMNVVTLGIAVKRGKVGCLEFIGSHSEHSIPGYSGTGPDMRGRLMPWVIRRSLMYNYTASSLVAANKCIIVFTTLFLITKGIIRDIRGRSMDHTPTFIMVAQNSQLLFTDDRMNRIYAGYTVSLGLISVVSVPLAVKSLLLTVPFTYLWLHLVSWQKTKPDYVAVVDKYWAKYRLGTLLGYQTENDRRGQYLRKAQ